MEAGTVTGAAVRMRRSQPQISRLVSDLERELGFQVFARHKKRLIPTSEGREFYARSLHILDQLEEIPGIVREITGRSDAFLRIACQSYIAQALLPEALGKFIKDRAVAALLGEDSFPHGNGRGGVDPAL